ncbi:hypothetical protein [Robbsia andropogonis]|uniref:hypothetical protein n=1 Tax=Robbsia andropogonis TaxID=28092 RepID=UPI002A69CC24|nr:hypothetical protein [Robbsia andropogonis]
MSKSRFQGILDEAVGDIRENGFSDIARYQSWIKRLRLAALMDASSAGADSDIAAALEAALRRATTKTAIMRSHPGVPLYTVQRIEPRFRAELNRRIMASADLIKANKEQGIEKTIQRFAGWASSVPDGGSRVIDVREVKSHISKPLRQQSFEARRLSIDQGHKLISAVNSVIADQTGAIAGKWHSRFRQAGYDYREDHRERDGKIYLIRGSWAHQQGLVKTGAAGYTDQITQAAEEPFCRCSYEYMRNLRDLPPEMLTEKGKAALEAARVRK